MNLNRCCFCTSSSWSSFLWAFNDFLIGCERARYGNLRLFGHQSIEWKFVIHINSQLYTLVLRQLKKFIKASRPCKDRRWNLSGGSRLAFFFCIIANNTFHCFLSYKIKDLFIYFFLIFSQKRAWNERGKTEHTTISKSVIHNEWVSWVILLCV